MEEEEEEQDNINIRVLFIYDYNCNNKYDDYIAIMLNIHSMIIYKWDGSSLGRL